MERLKTIALARAAVGATVCALALIGWSGAALASPPSVTLSGSSTNEFTGEHPEARAEVSATLNDGVASGTLSTGGWEPKLGAHHNSFDIFTGNVTCMVVRGSRVTVGALGTVSVQPLEGPPTTLPGTYAQLLTVEFGEFEAGRHFLPDSFGSLGEYHEGLLSASPPNCHHASFEHQSLPYGQFSQGAIYLSPSITSPTDGHISRNGTVTLSGTGEPNRAIKVYEVGDEAGATEVTANANGEWSLTLSGLSAGTHVFTASAVNGSEVPANTVEVEVVAPPPPPPPPPWHRHWPLRR